MFSFNLLLPSILSTKSCAARKYITSPYGLSYLTVTLKSQTFQTFFYATEYGAGNMASMDGDIYSYGILVLETVTGKRPTDSKFTQGLSLREFVELGLHGSVLDAVDTQLCLVEKELQTADSSSCKAKLDGLISLLRLGVSCSHEVPSKRLPTGDIIKELREIKESLM